MEEIVAKLKEQISKLVREKGQKAVVQVYIENTSMGLTLFRSSDAPEYKDLQEKLNPINRALSVSDEDTRVKLITELLTLWFRGSDKQVRDVLGDCVKLRSIRKAMFTLTGDGRQLRVWYSFPGSIRYDHVDSCGEGLLLGVYGHPDHVRRYLNAFLSVTNLAEAQSKEGVRLYVGQYIKSSRLY
jgi:hypothetical protein